MVKPYEVDSGARNRKKTTRKARHNYVDDQEDESEEDVQLPTFSEQTYCKSDSLKKACIRAPIALPHYANPGITMENLNLSKFLRGKAKVSKVTVLYDRN